MIDFTKALELEDGTVALLAPHLSRPGDHLTVSFPNGAPRGWRHPFCCFKADGSPSGEARSAGILRLRNAVEPSTPQPEWQMGGDLTLRELQVNLPWSIRYSADFRANPQPHKDFAHALLHITKASGKLAGTVDDMDHRKETADNPALREAMEPYIADMVICALRMANTFPGGPIDLQRAVHKRLETKNGTKLPPPGRHMVDLGELPPLQFMSLLR